MDKDKVIDYVMSTPHNANRQVLEGMLDGASGGAGLPAVSGEDEGKVLTVVNGEWNKAESSVGYECNQSLITAFEGNVESVAMYYDEKGALIDGLDLSTTQPSTIFVTFNGIEYECPVAPTGSYGITDRANPDWSEYPFQIIYTNADFGLGTYIFTESTGVNSLKVEWLSESVEVSDCFTKAVNKITNGEGIIIVKFRGGTQIGSSYTGQQLLDLLESGTFIEVINTEPSSLRCARAICVRRAANDFGGLEGFGAIFVEPQSTVSLMVNEYYVPLNETGLNMKRQLEFLSRS